MIPHAYRGYGQDHHITPREQEDEWKRANPGTPLEQPMEDNHEHGSCRAV